jgi:hypothetical protein
MLSRIVDTADEDRSFVPFTGDGDEVVLLVNGLGAVSELEMGGIGNEGVCPRHYKPNEARTDGISQQVAGG